MVPIQGGLPPNCNESIAAITIGIYLICAENGTFTTFPHETAIFEFATL